MAKQTNEKTLVIDLSEEYKIKIEDPDKLSGSFFEEIYLKAADAVDDIIEQTESNKKMDKNDPFLNEKQDYNNIIAFCGERGTGKSSAMISFAQSLLKLNDSKVFYTGKSLTSKNFHTIKVIDPSLFEEHENIFEVILAQLFSSFEKELNKKEKDSELNTKRELLEQFEKVYENLQTIRKDGQKYDGEALETLNKLACGANLRQNFKELVRLYLNFIVGKEKSDDAYLVIPIDDFDLNVKASAEMAEQIRKYLMIPKVIILMAADVNQLSKAIEIDMLKKFDQVNDKQNLELKSKTLNYLTKFIPENRRLKLEYSISKLESNLEVIFDLSDTKSLHFPIGYSLKALENVGQSEKFIVKNLNTRHFIQTLTYNKTCFFSEKIDLIIPSSLRDFIEFLHLLLLMEENQKYGNLQKLKNYILEKTCFAQLTIDENNIIFQWMKTPIESKNHFIINVLYNRIKNEFESRLGEKYSSNYYIGDRFVEDETSIVRTRPYSNLRLEIREILDKKVNTVNISLGDVLLFIKYYYRNASDSENNAFAITLKSLISIELLSHFFRDNKNSKQQLSALIAGNVYNSTDISPLRGNIKNTKRHVFPFLTESVNYNREEGFIFEWLIFFISRIGVELNRKREVVLHRQSIYLDAGSIQVKNLEFNILNFLATVLDIELQKERLYGNSKKDCKSSIFSEMQEIEESQIALLLNIEVIEKFVKHDYTPPKDKIKGAFYFHFEKFANEFLDLIKSEYDHILKVESSFIVNNPLFKYFQTEFLKNIASKYKTTNLIEIINFPDDNILERNIYDNKEKLEHELTRIKTELLKNIERIKNLDFLEEGDKVILLRRFELAITLNDIFFYNYFGKKDKTKTINLMLSTIFSNIREAKRTESLRKYLIHDLEILKKYDITIDIEDINNILNTRKRFDLRKEEIIARINENVIIDE